MVRANANQTRMIEELTLKGASINLVRDRQGRLGMDGLMKPDAATTEAKSPDRHAESANDTGKIGPPVILGKKIRLEDGSLRCQDSALTGSSVVQAWSQTIPQRCKGAMQQAREALEKMPYPPAVN